ncbi:MAG: sulfite exporter TauE/SafE family protein [Dehalococcoidales bacterium]|nr:sulfite exporter TauE/SafE family protein [Dehalococcoidales bacterium]
MIELSIMQGTEISVLLLVVLSLATGVISGFVGLGGGFIMTPALIILGFPAHYAVGTSILWVMGNSIIGTFRHRHLGNVDFKLGGIMIVFLLCGVELGVRAITAAKNAGLAETSVLLVTICSLLVVGSSVFWESTQTRSRLDKLIKENKEANESISFSLLISLTSRIQIPPVIHFSKSNTRISVWMLMLLGLVAGTLSSFIGVGGGFIIVPSLVYLFGVPSFVAVGTNLFQIIAPTAFGAARHTLDANIVIFASFVMIMGSSAGIYFGSLLTRYLREVSMRYTLASSILVAVIGSIFKLITIISRNETDWIQLGIKIITFGGLALIVCILIGLFIAAIRHKDGKYIPIWVQSLVRD